MNKNKTRDQSVVPDGYKRTEVGIIPENWDEVQIGDIATVKGGKRLPSGFALVDTPTPHPYVRVKDMYPGGVNQSEIKYVPEQAFSVIQNYRIYSEDVFISVAGTLGIVGVIPPELSGANLTENANYITDLKCNRDYLKYCLMSHPIQKTIELIQTTGAQPKLALGRIAAFVIPMPQDIDEQHAIAEALSDVDGLIKALDALIAKKRAIKQAAMQQLLTGKTRLPGFSRAWETKQLGEIASFFKGSSLFTKTDISLDGKRRCVHYGELFTTYGEYISEVLHGTNREEAFFLSVRNDVLMPASDVTPNGLATASCISESGIILGGDILVIRVPAEILNGVFLAYAIKINRNQVMQLVTGTTVYHLYGRDMANFKFDVPSIQEQRAIAAVLSDMDSEIAALEQRLDKTRAIKQGMMQQLLTARVRLVKNGNE